MNINHPVFPTTTTKEETMKNIIAIVAVLIFVAFSVQAADQRRKPANSQQQACSERAKEMGLKGDARKSFMNDCLGVSAKQKQPYKPSSSNKRNK
jgi:hypothetical protein